MLPTIWSGTWCLKICFKLFKVYSRSYFLNIGFHSMNIYIYSWIKVVPQLFLTSRSSYLCTSIELPKCGLQVFLITLLFSTTEIDSLSNLNFFSLRVLWGRCQLTFLYFLLNSMSLIIDIYRVIIQLED